MIPEHSVCISRLSSSVGTTAIMRCAQGRRGYRADIYMRIFRFSDLVGKKRKINMAKREDDSLAHTRNIHTRVEGKDYHVHTPYASHQHQHKKPHARAVTPRTECTWKPLNVLCAGHIFICSGGQTTHTKLQLYVPLAHEK